jgi:AcrR family transcriptional regulator
MIWAMVDNPKNIKENDSIRKLVASGKTLFFKYGFKKVTVEEICQDARVSKMTFYRFFDNKIALVIFIINEMSDEGLRIYRNIMDRDVPFEEKIRDTIRMKHDAANQYSEEFLKDVYGDKKGGVMPLLQQISATAMTMVMEDYRIAQEQGFIRKDLNLAFIPYILNKINEMVNDPVLLAMYGDMHAIMREVTNLFFYGISAITGYPEE